MVSIHYGSPASADLLGIGKVIENIIGLIKDLKWKGKIEKEAAVQGIIKLKTEIEKQELENEKQRLENEK